MKNLDERGQPHARLLSAFHFTFLLSTSSCSFRPAPYFLFIYAEIMEKRIQLISMKPLISSACLHSLNPAIRLARGLVHQKARAAEQVNTWLTPFTNGIIHGMFPQALRDNCSLNAKSCRTAPAAV